MTQEEEFILYKDICAKLPYGVKCLHKDFETGEDYVDIISGVACGDKDGLFEVDGYMYEVNEIKPYLRPMSSMTKGEEQFILNVCEEYLNEGINIMNDNFINLSAAPDCIDYLNSHHFDYHNLIEKGLALVAPEGMYRMTKI